jgi:hypothetical protein
VTIGFGLAGPTASTLVCSQSISRTTSLVIRISS